MANAVKTKPITFELIPKYVTSTNEEVSQEIEIILSTFENAKVVGGKKVHKTVRIPVGSETRPSFHPVLDITVVEGYPYVPPKVELVFPARASVEGGDIFTGEEVIQLKEEINNNIQPCLHMGMPCMMQIVSTVLYFMSTVDDKVSEVADEVPDTNSSSVVANSPAPTPVPLKAKDALRLGLLALYLLRKCCFMKDPESLEESTSNFDWLSSYLIETAHVFPPIVQRLLPWKADAFLKVFAKEIGDNERVEPHYLELKKWFWESEELPHRIQQGCEGRYQNEFIQQRLLGSGGFAPVYMCRKKIDGRLYAVKKIVMKDNRSEKIIREVQTLAALNHKNIVRYYDAWVEDGCDEELRMFIEEEQNGSENDEDCSCEEQRRGRKAVHSTCALRLAKDDFLSESSNRSFSATTSSIEYGSNNTDDEDTSDTSSDTEFGPYHNEIKTPAHSGVKFPAHRLQTLYIQMELCSARSLRHLIDESDRGSGIFASEKGEKIAASILRQLLVVIAHTHHENIVHRDLKPDNVLFEMGNTQVEGEIGTIRVADFGLARVMNGMKQTASTCKLDEMHDLMDTLGNQNNDVPTGNCGSVLYCAPEQSNGISYGFKVDEFSIGMIALEMWLSILGKGFRDRFNIMEQVWKKGILPEWFVKCKPPIAEVIGSLLEHDPQKRRTCEEVLSTAELPGDPVDIIEALQTIDRYGERLACRVIQKVQKLTTQYRKPSPQLRQSAQFLGSWACAQVTQAIDLVGMLHGSIHIGLVDPLIPINPDLSELGVEVVTDSAGRSYAFTALPQLPVASFLGMQENAGIGSFHCFYHKLRPYAVFMSPMHVPDVLTEALLDPFLNLVHLISLMELTHPIEIILSHADWLNVVYPRLGHCQAPRDFSSLRICIDSAEKSGPAISDINEMLSKLGVASSFTRDELLRKFLTTMLNVIHFFGKHISSQISIILDPTLLPSQTLAHHFSIDRGMIVECRTTSGVSFAFGCSMENYVSKCTVLNAEMYGYSITLDIYELATNWKYFYIPTMERVLDGVAIRRQDLYSQSQLDNVIEAAVELWKGNTPAYLSIDADLHAMAKKMRVRKLRWVLFDGKKLVPVSRIHQTKTTKYPEITTDRLCSTIRSLCEKEKSSSKMNVDVAFISMKEDFVLAEDAKKAFISIMTTKWSPVLVMDVQSSDIEACFDEKKRLTEFSAAQQALCQWIGGNIAHFAVVSVYSCEDEKISLFVNQKKFKPAHKKERNKRKKK